MPDIQEIIEERIKKMLESEEFRQSPYKGKPYRFDGYLFENPKTRLANYLLRRSNMLPEHLRLRKEIVDSLQRLKTERKRIHAIIRQKKEQLDHFVKEHGIDDSVNKNFLQIMSDPIKRKSILKNLNDARQLAVISKTKNFLIFIHRMNRHIEHMVNETNRLITEYNHQIIRLQVQYPKEHRFEETYPLLRAEDLHIHISKTF